MSDLSELRREAPFSRPHHQIHIRRKKVVALPSRRGEGCTHSAKSDAAANIPLILGSAYPPLVYSLRLQLGRRFADANYAQTNSRHNLPRMDEVNFHPPFRRERSCNYLHSFSFVRRPAE